MSPRTNENWLPDSSGTRHSDSRAAPRRTGRVLVKTPRTRALSLLPGWKSLDQPVFTGSTLPDAVAVCLGHRAGSPTNQWAASTSSTATTTTHAWTQMQSPSRLE